MRNPLTLKTRLFTILTALILISLAGGIIMVWYTYRMERLLSNIIQKHLAAYESAETLETALVNQKGFVSYYFMDGNPDWLRQLGKYRQIFRGSLAGAKRLAETPAQVETIDRIEMEYDRYVVSKDQVIEYYKTGQIQQGAELHKRVRGYFNTILELCHQYKTIHKNQIMRTRDQSHDQAHKLRIIAGAAVSVSFFLALGLVFFLYNQILGPIKRLTREADRESDEERPANEIKALDRSVRTLIHDVDNTRQELEKSREHLVQSEKLALVGKLAAGMAHSIRNPFTSVKMRLFSLGRTLSLTATQKDDLDVISEEIRHIDTIVQNFLEFSRPPRLQVQNISPSVVVDQALQLLIHRLKSYGVKIDCRRVRPIPAILLDPEQLKEVLVNLIVNACEAMIRGGLITIRENIDTLPVVGKTAIIQLTDDGPGIPSEIMDKIFQPFFTTKEDGTGLGLSIASRIIEEHQGRLEVESREGRGTTFRILLPLEPCPS